MKNVIYKLVAVAALLVGAPSAFAQNLAVPAQSGVINGAGQTFTINFTPGADSGGFDFVLNAAPAANLTITAATGTIPNGTTVCTVTASSVTCFSNANAPTTDLGAGTISVTYNGGATAGPINLNFASSNFFSQAGPAEPGTTTNGVLTLNSGPTAPTVGPLAALTLPAGPINLTATGSVPVSVASAGVATASLALACSIPPTGASAFAVTSGGTRTINAPATVGPATPIGVSCVRGAADVTATLTCTQTATPGPNPASLTAAITCLAGTTAPNPGSVPAAPGPVALIGAPGATATGSVSFTNVGGTLAYTVTGCTPSAGYTTATTFPVNVAIGGTGSVGVSCTAPTAAGTSGPTGTLACTTSAAGFNPTFNLTCSSQVASIPTLGMAGKALMVLMMLGFGLVGFQLYRRSA
ncbi:MAG: hypothetical protein LW860_18425 [Xanthomonadaceae bacterium]|jgi:hypothetical protein|nr:hypothetical protein [Xanthomonadaceae bacterium]